MRAKTGILGGSFDPPHVGHVTMARTAKEVLGLDSVLLMPAPKPPHKDLRGLSAWETRLEMTRLAADDVLGVEASSHELDTAGSSFTVESLRRYRAANDNDVYFILGSDSLLDLPNWREPETILKLATIVVFLRAGFDPVLNVRGDASLIVFESPVVDVSSSGIRENVRAGKSIETLVPGRVLEYITKHSLYSH